MYLNVDYQKIVLYENCMFSTEKNSVKFFYRSSERQVVRIARRPDGNTGRRLLERARRRHTAVRRSVFQHELRREKRARTSVGPRPDRRAYRVRRAVRRARRRQVSATTTTVVTQPSKEPNYYCRFDDKTYYGVETAG